MSSRPVEGMRAGCTRRSYFPEPCLYAQLVWNAFLNFPIVRFAAIFDENLVEFFLYFWAFRFLRPGRREFSSITYVPGFGKPAELPLTFFC